MGAGVLGRTEWGGRDQYTLPFTGGDFRERLAWNPGWKAGVGPWRAREAEWMFRGFSRETCGTEQALKEPGGLETPGTRWVLGFDQWWFGLWRKEVRPGLQMSVGGSGGRQGRESGQPCHTSPIASIFSLK